ncbi:hypothetical protein [Microbispora sp. H10836]|uniref:hypothetical protein n=1 Tax=Microbispora sp. H10836 TaxID=2729106 RepID=UPI0014748622|nr:hypothetical protein [Microbispora sp. H10836]
MRDVLRRAVRRVPVLGHLRTFTSLSAAGLGEAVLPALSLIALVRTTGTQTSGQVIFAQSVAGLWFLLSNPCLENAAQRFVPVEQRQTGQGSALFLLLLRWSAGLGAAATAVALVAVLALGLPGLISDDAALMIALSVVGRQVTAPYATAGAGFALADRLRVLGTLRIRAALLSFCLSLAGLYAGGPLLYLAGQAVGSLLMTAVICRAATRAAVSALGPPTGRPRLPAGLAAYTVQTSLGTAVAGISDTGILTVAGLVGGPALVTTLKIASAPGRFYANFAVPVAAMLYPRIARAAADGEGGVRIRRDVLRATLLLTLAGVVVVTTVFPLMSTVIAVAYGKQYAGVAAAATPLLAAACVKGVVCWSNVLPLAVGRAGRRLAYLSAEAALLVALLATANLAASGTLPAAAAYGWGALALAAACSAFWIASLPGLVERIRLPEHPVRPAAPAESGGPRTVV